MKNNKYFRLIIQLFWSLIFCLFTYSLILNILWMTTSVQLCDLIGGRARNTLLYNLPLEGNTEPLCKKSEVPFGSYVGLLCPCICCAPKLNVYLFTAFLLLVFTISGIKYYRRSFNLRQYIISLIVPFATLILILFLIFLYKSILNRRKYQSCQYICYEKMYGSGKTVDEYEKLFLEDNRGLETFQNCMKICNPPKEE